MADRTALLELLSAGVDALGLALPADVLARQVDFLALLARWNARFNLTAVREPRAMVTRHLLDSLALLPHLRGNQLADLGSGAGLPGIVLAMAEPRLTVTSVDANGKKIRFQRAAVRELGLGNVEPVQCRVEALQGRFAQVTTRAFASLGDTLALAGHLLPPGGRLLALKGRCPDEELAQIGAPYRVGDVRPLQVPGLDAERHLVIIERTEDCP